MCLVVSDRQAFQRQLLSPNEYNGLADEFLHFFIDLMRFMVHLAGWKQ